jgi:hypothetical protein
LNHDEPSGPSDDEYGVVQLPDSLPVLSLLCFLGALAARYLADVLPAGWRLSYPRFLVSVILVLLLSGLGLLLGLLGLRAPRSRGMARIAALLNGIALALGLLGVAAVSYILPD